MTGRSCGNEGIGFDGAACGAAGLDGGDCGAIEEGGNELVGGYAAAEVGVCDAACEDELEDAAGGKGRVAS